MSTTRVCRRTTSAASNISAEKSGSIFTATASSGLPSKTLCGLSSFRCTRRSADSGARLASYMPDYKVYPEVQQFLGEQESYRAELMQQLKDSADYRDFVSEEQLWTNFKLMEVYDQMGQFVCNRYPFNSTRAKKWPESDIEQCANADSSRQERHDPDFRHHRRKPRHRNALSLRHRSSGRFISGRASFPSGATRIKTTFLKNTIGPSGCMINYSLHSH